MLTAVVCALQLDDDELPVAVDGQKVHTPPGVLSLAELLRDDKEVLVEHVNPVPQKPLQILPLAKAQGRKGGWLPHFEARIRDFVEGHRHVILAGYAPAARPFRPAVVSARVVGARRNLPAA